MGEYDYTETRVIEALLDQQPPCANGCVINSLVGGDHAYCECYCHASLPAIPPSRERRPATEEASR